MRGRGDERGQAAVLVLGLVLVAFAVAGLAVDGTRAFLARRTLQNAADASALAGASELDQSTLYESGGLTVALDPASARREAARWLATRSLPARAGIAADANEVRVVLRDSLPTTFLALVGIGSIPVAAEASAQPVAGRAPP